MLAYNDSIFVGFVIVVETALILIFLNRLGKRLVFLELLALIAWTQWIVAPLIAYKLGGLMRVAEGQYFAYAFPGACAYILCLCWPLYGGRRWDQAVEGVVSRIVKESRGEHVGAIFMIIIGAFLWLILNVVPEEVRMIVYLISQIFIVGLCKLLLSDYKWRGVWYIVGLGVILFTTLFNGMIGTLLFWLVITFIVYSARKKLRIHLLIKLFLFFIGLWVLLALQVAKTDYRIKTWHISRSDVNSKVIREIRQDPALMLDLFVKNISNPNKLLRDDNMVKLAARLNQGILVSYGMKYVNRHDIRENGEVTILSSLKALIPRLVWRNKPTVGQHDYFERYTGIKLSKYNSSTLGPIGDFYVDFGALGILFLGLFGMGISTLFYWYIRKSLRAPVYFFGLVVIYINSTLVSEVSVAGFVSGTIKLVIVIEIGRIVLALLKEQLSWH